MLARAPAAANQGYNTFLGDSADYNQTVDAAMYNSTAPLWAAWAGENCTSVQAAMCEVPASVAYGSCPFSAPPSAPPPATQPSTGLCLPPNDATRYCQNNRPGNSTAAGTPSCFVFNATLADLATHEAACAAQGGPGCRLVLRVQAQWPCCMQTAASALAAVKPRCLPAPGCW